MVLAAGPGMPGHTLHLTRRGRLHAACFFATADREAYLHWLGEYARSTGCAVHAYALMGNHVHLLLTPSRADGIATLLRLLEGAYARHIADCWNRFDALWEEGVSVTPVHVHRYVLACMRYIELNPVRARMARSAEQFRWSSHACNALGEANALITPHSAYAALARGAAARQEAYRAFCQGVRPGGARRQR